MRRIVFVAIFTLCGLLALSAGFLRQAALTEVSLRPDLGEDTLEARSSNAFARILGEMRATTADFIYAKTEVYFHNGVLYVPHLDHAGISRGEDDDDHCDQEEQIIRSKEEDFRGLIGYLEREVKPYDKPGTPHKHAPGTELLPWYRLMILADPSNLRSYMSAAMWLANEGEEGRALELLDDGIDRNPGHPMIFQLYLSQTVIFSRLAEYEVAYETATEGLELALAVRPTNGKIGERVRGGMLWSEMAEEDFLFMFRYRVLMLIQLGRNDEALAIAQDMIRLVPDDRPIRRIIEGMNQ